MYRAHCFEQYRAHHRKPDSTVLKQIAARLVISPKTVANHTEHIYAKTGAGNRVAASLFAVEHGLLPVE